jgi:hypothetical protein
MRVSGSPFCAAIHLVTCDFEQSQRRDAAKQERSDFARRMLLRSSPLASDPAFDLTHEIALLDRKIFQAKRITSGGQ